MNQPPVFAGLLLGPTASGKSAASMHVARHLPAQIISVDSALVYRDMDIGTAKPGPQDRLEVPHHLIDIIDPADTYSAARFAEDANQLIDVIANQHCLPLLVGGTMLYAKALTEGLNDLPAADAELRTELDAQAARAGWPAMHARLTTVDPETAARLQPTDSQRIQRALEIFMLTGTTMSALLRDQREKPSNRRWLKIALEPSDRAVLHQRIAKRLHQMIEEGLVDEVHALRARGDLNLNLPSMRCVGYRQIWEHLDGQYDLDTAIERAIVATRQLAKRQLTWLRSMPDRIVVDCLAPDANQRILELVQEHQ